MDDEEDFTLFGELTPAEEACQQARRNHMQGCLEAKLSQFQADPTCRTMAENRIMFNHQRSQNRFSDPVVIPHLFTLQDCQAILASCQSMPSSTWTTARHSAFATTDIPIRDTSLAYLADMVRERLFPHLGKHYGFHATRDLDFRDIFLVRYSAQGQSGLRLHTDGCLISFNILINHQDEFQGGGTYFASTDSVVHIQQGDCVYHDARIMHRGVDISDGERYILVGFVDTKDTIEKDKGAATRRMEKV